MVRRASQGANLIVQTLVPKGGDRRSLPRGFTIPPIACRSSPSRIFLRKKKHLSKSDPKRRPRRCRGTTPGLHSPRMANSQRLLAIGHRWGPKSVLALMGEGESVWHRLELGQGSNPMQNAVCFQKAFSSLNRSLLTAVGSSKTNAVAVYASQINPLRSPNLSKFNRFELCQLAISWNWRCNNRFVIACQ